METRTKADVERRVLPAGIELRQSDDGESELIVGHAAVFDQEADLMFIREKIAPKAFKASIKKDDIRALFNHDPNHVLGRTPKTLRLKEDDSGLLTEIDPPDTQIGRDVMTSIRRGDISGMSIGFRTLKDEWDFSDPMVPLRTIRQVELLDVSPVTFPAYPQTDVSVARRSLDDWCRKHKPAFRPRLLAAKRQAAAL